MRPRMVWLLPALALGLMIAAPRPTLAGSAAEKKTEAAGKKTAATAKKSDNVLDNASITAQVKTALLADKVAPGIAINVDTVDRVVTLKGQVDTAQQKARAAQVARKVKGVKKVVNQLTVKAHAAKPAAQPHK